MRVKLQLIMGSDDGQEEIITDIVALKKDAQRIEHLGLTLKEAKRFCRHLSRADERRDSGGGMFGIPRTLGGAWTPCSTLARCYPRLMLCRIFLTNSVRRRSCPVTMS